MVIDGAAKMERVTASAIKAADFVLIPVRHSGFDLWAVESLVESIQARRLVAEGRPGAAFVVSCQIARSSLAGSIEAASASFGLPVLKARTTHRVAYAEAIGYGVTVLDLANRTKAAAEVEAITDELLEMLSDEEDQPGRAPHRRSPEHAAEYEGDQALAIPRQVDKKQLHVHLPASLHTRLKLHAVEQGRNMTASVVEALREYLEG